MRRTHRLLCSVTCKALTASNVASAASNQKSFTTSQAQ